MNLAEVVHAGWVKRDKMNMSLVDAAYADARDNIQLEVQNIRQWKCTWWEWANFTGQESTVNS
jgi:hypothetical protein